LWIPSLALAVAVVAGGQAPPARTKVGVVYLYTAIDGTQEGKKAASDLQARYGPRREQIAEKQKEIAALQDQLSRGANTMSDEAKESLRREIEQKTRSVNRAAEDAQTDLEQDQSRILQRLGPRMLAIVDKYARDNAYELVLDVSNVRVLFAANAVDITSDVVALYDKNNPGATATAPPAAAPSKPPPLSKPAATAPSKQP
jgi:outer membrane protein